VLRTINHLLRVVLVLVPHNVQMRFDWTDLRVFLYACDTGSMTEAASCSNLTLAAVSSRIRGLEESIGILLLRRHARGVVATAAGEALARHARLLFHQLDALRRGRTGSKLRRLRLSWAATTL